MVSLLIKLQALELSCGGQGGFGVGDKGSRQSRQGHQFEQMYGCGYL